MPANYARSVLITGIHTEVGEYTGYEFMGNDWFVIGCDTSHHTSYFARNHIQADVTDLAEYRRAVATAARIGNGLDVVINCSQVPMFGLFGEDYIRAAAESLHELHGAIVNELSATDLEHHHLPEIKATTRHFADMDHGIRVNTIAPFLSAAPHGQRASYSGTDADEFLAHLNSADASARLPMNAIEIAAAVYFLAAEPINGETLSADDSLPARL